MQQRKHLLHSHSLTDTVLATSGAAAAVPNWNATLITLSAWLQAAMVVALVVHTHTFLL